MNINSLILFLIWPFGALLNALRRISSIDSRQTIWLFLAFFGLVFIYEDPGLAVFGRDSATYAASLIDYHNNPISFAQLLHQEFYINGQIDIYQPLVTWMLSWITDDPKFLFMVFASVFGYFLIQSAWCLIKESNFSSKYEQVIYLLLFVLLNPIWNINGVRMWTAAQIFVFGIILLFLQKRKIGIIWIMLSIFVHFSFLFPIAILLLFWFLPKKLFIFFLFYCLCVFSVELDLSYLKTIAENLPTIYQSKVASYTNEQYIESVSEEELKLSWHVTFSGILLKYIAHAWIFFLVFSFKRWKNLSSYYYNFFLFIILFAGLSHVATQFPSGARFLTLANQFLFGFVLILIGKHHLIIGQKFVRSIAAISLLFPTFFLFRTALDFVGLSIFLSNPIFALFNIKEIPLIDFIK